MIKIEKLTQGCSANLSNGKEVYPGQLINNNELEGIVVRNGTLTISIDELEIKDIRSKEELSELYIKELQDSVAKEIQEIDSAKTSEIIANTRENAIKELQEIVEQGEKNKDSAKSPQILDSAKSPQKITHSAKSPHISGK